MNSIDYCSDLMLISLYIAVRNLELFFLSFVVRKQKKKEEEAPAKLLDDLFRKTKSTPCIYWLPLTAEQVC